MLSKTSSLANSNAQILGVVVSGYSVFAMEASYGETPPVSTTIKCVLNLTAQCQARDPLCRDVVRTPSYVSRKLGVSHEELGYSI